MIVVIPSSGGGPPSPDSNWLKLDFGNQGWGGLTNIDLWYNINGKNIDIAGTCFCSAPDALEARINLPSGITVFSNIVGSHFIVGYLHRDIPIDLRSGMRTIIVENGSNFMNFGMYGVFSPLTPRSGSQSGGIDNLLSIQARIPIL